MYAQPPSRPQSQYNNNPDYDSPRRPSGAYSREYVGTPPPQTSQDRIPSPPPQQQRSPPRQQYQQQQQQYPQQPYTSDSPRSSPYPSPQNLPPSRPPRSQPQPRASSTYNPDMQIPPQLQPQYYPPNIDNDDRTPPNGLEPDDIGVQDDNDDFYQPNQYDQDQLYVPTSQSIQSQSLRTSSPPPLQPLLDHSHLRPGNQAALLSHERTLELYRANAKKTQDPDLIFEFAVFMIDASKSMPMPVPTPGNVMDVERAVEKREDLIKEAMALLRRGADRGHMPSQYFLADCYANGIGTPKGKQDFDKAFPLFILAAKHGHPDASYRAGTCCENGWGCRRESAKALQFFKKAAAAGHPGAMYRLGIAELNGELGLTKSPKEGVKWLKRSAEHASAEFPHALHELALLHERGIDNVLFVDYEYSAELLAQAAELGYAPSAYRLGECYEYGKMGCPQDPALSIHYYNIAAQQNHRDACFALTAWYLVGSPGVLPQSDTEAYLWARKAAEAGLVKAMYAVGYFSECGIGTQPDMKEAIVWYKKAADQGDKRSQQRLKASTATPIPNPAGPGSVLSRDTAMSSELSGKGGKDKDCVIM